MVNRPSVDRSAVDPLKRLKRDVTEVVAALGRGAAGLTSPSRNHELTMLDAQSPTLSATDQDIGVQFSAGAGTVTDETGQNLRDWIVRTLTAASATITGSATIGGKATIDGELDVEGASFFYGGVNCNGLTLGRTSNGNWPALISTEQNVALIFSNGALFVANPGNTAAAAINASNIAQASEATMKRVGDDPPPRAAAAVLDRLGGLVRRFTWRDPTAPGADAGEHIGFVVDELAEQPATAWLVTEPDGYGIRSWHARDIIALLVSDRETTLAELAALRARVEHLEGRA